MENENFICTHCPHAGFFHSEIRCEHRDLNARYDCPCRGFDPKKGAFAETIAGVGKEAA